MKVLTTLTVSGGLNMASAAKDTFTIGTPLEYNDGNVDDLTVYANADFKNNVILGSSSVDTVTVNAQLTASNGVQVNALKLNGSQIEIAWSSYNVSWTSDGTQPSLNNGTLTGYYKQIGKIVFVRVKLNWGSTTNGGTGAWRFSLPVSASAPEAIQFPCSLLDDGVAWYQGIVNGTYSGLTDRSAIIVQSLNSNTSQGVSATIPFTWGSGSGTDGLQFNGSYEAA